MISDGKKTGSNGCIRERKVQFDEKEVVVERDEGGRTRGRW